MVFRHKERPSGVLAFHGVRMVNVQAMLGSLRRLWLRMRCYRFFGFVRVFPLSLCLLFSHCTQPVCLLLPTQAARWQLLLVGVPEGCNAPVGRLPSNEAFLRASLPLASFVCINRRKTMRREIQGPGRKPCLKLCCSRLGYQFTFGSFWSLNRTALAWG